MPQGKPLDQELIQKIIEDIREGKRLRALWTCFTYRAIGERYGLHHNTIWGIGKMDEESDPEG